MSHEISSKPCCISVQMWELIPNFMRPHLILAGSPSKSHEISCTSREVSSKSLRFQDSVQILWALVQLLWDLSPNLGISQSKSHENSSKSRQISGHISWYLIQSSSSYPSLERSPPNPSGSSPNLVRSQSKTHKTSSNTCEISVKISWRLIPKLIRSQYESYEISSRSCESSVKISWDLIPNFMRSHPVSWDLGYSR